jgi:hypothetical protein
MLENVQQRQQHWKFLTKDLPRKFSCVLQEFFVAFLIDLYTGSGMPYNLLIQLLFENSKLSILQLSQDVRHHSHHSPHVL